MKIIMDCEFEVICITPLPSVQANKKINGLSPQSPLKQLKIDGYLLEF